MAITPPKLKLPALSKLPLPGKRRGGIFGLDVKREAAISTPAVFGLKERGAPVLELPTLPKLPRVEALPREPGMFPRAELRAAPPEVPEKDTLFKKAARFILPKSLEVKLGLTKPTKAEEIRQWGRDIEEYYGRGEDIIGGIRTFGEGLTKLPKATAVAILQSTQGYEGASVVDKDWADRYIEDATTDLNKFIQETEEKYRSKLLVSGLPLKITDLAEFPQNLAFSLTSMGAGLGVGVPIGLIPLPGARVAAWTLGTAASGKVAYEMTTYQITQQYLEAKNEEKIAKTGKGLTLEEEKQLKDEFGYLAAKYGLWEAIPEAVSNLAFVKILTAPLLKMGIGKTITGRILTKITGLYGEELLTETITQKGQSAIEIEAGLREGKISWMEAFKEIAPQTFLLTTIMAGSGSTIIQTKKGINKITDSLKNEIGTAHLLYDQLKIHIEETMAEIRERPEAGFIRLPGKRLVDYNERLKDVQELSPIPEKDIIPFEDFEKFRTDGKMTHETLRKNLDKILKEGISEPFGYLGHKTKAEFVIKNPVIIHIEIPSHLREGLNFGMRADEINANVDIKPEWIIRAIDVDTGKVIFGKAVKPKPAIKPEVKPEKIIKEARVPGVPIKKAIREVTRQVKPGLTQFTKRMRDLIRGVREGRIATKQEIKATQTEILNIIDKSELELKDKAKFRATIKNIQTQEQLLKHLPEIQERIERLAEASEVRTLKGQIKGVLAKTKVRMQAGKPVGKFTPIVQKVLDSAREAIKLNAVESEAKIMDNLDRHKEKTMPIEVAVQNRILDMNSQGPTGLRELLATIKEIKETGAMAKALKDFNIQEQLDREKSYLIDVVTDYKGIAKGRQTTGREKADFKTRAIQSLKSLGQNFILSWRGLMQVLDWHTQVDKKTLADKYSVLKQENEYKALQEDYINDFNQMFADVYDIPTKTIKDKVALPLKLNREIGKLKKEVDLGTFKNTLGQEVEIRLTRDEMIKRHMEFQDETLYDSFREGNNYTEEIKDAITAELTNQEKELADKEIKLYRKQYDRVNPVYRKMSGVDLPFNEFYSPIIREGYKIDLKEGFQIFLDEAGYRKAVTSKSFITRIRNALPIARQGSLEALDRHITQTNYFLAWAERVRELDNIFADPGVREVIKEEFGGSLLRQIMNTIEDLAYKRRIRGDMHKSVDWFRKKFTMGALMLKPALAAKQMVSTVAYLEKLNPVEFTTGIVDFWRNPVKNYHTMAEESTFIRTRGKAGEIERDIRAAMRTDVYGRFSKLQNFWNMAMLNIRLGDKGAIVTGSWAMRRARLKKGVNLTETIRGYEEFSAETQQSADISQLSAIQKGGTFSVLFTMFKSSQRQYLAKEVNAIKTLFQKGGTSPKNIGKVARTLAIYHVLLPVLFQWVANFGGWDEDDRKEYLRAAVLGSLNGLFLFGDIIDGIIRAVMGLRTWPQEVPVASIGKDLEQAVKKVDLDDITVGDVKDALFELAEAGNSLGIPVQYMKNLPMGLKEIIEGDVYKGLGLLLGWSEYYLKEPKKKGLRLPALPVLPKLPSLPALPSLPSF